MALPEFDASSFYPLSAFAAPEIATYLVVENVTTTHFGRHVKHLPDFYPYGTLPFLFILGFRFFYEVFDTYGSPTLESCVLGFFYNSLPATALYADTTNNKCYFGSAETNSAIMSPAGSSWTAYIKQSNTVKLQSS